MRRLWIAVAFLAAVFAATLVNSHYLKTFSTELTSLLTQAESLAGRGEWSEAESLTQQALASWEEHDLYLYTMLRHSDTDQVHTGFQEVLEFIRCEEGGEYSAANARLVSQIELLYEMEEFSLKNLL